MIFLSVGNNELSFIRLFIKFEKILQKLNKKNVELICQTGHTEYKNKDFKIIKFLEKKKFNDLINKSSLFISHAGAGSVIDSIQNRKIPILLPREKKYNEQVIVKDFKAFTYSLRSGTVPLASSGWTINIEKDLEFFGKILEKDFSIDDLL